MLQVKFPSSVFGTEVAVSGSEINYIIVTSEFTTVCTYTKFGVIP